MHTKIIVMVVSFAVALASLGAGAAGAQNAGSSCPELRAACQPIGNRPVDAQPSGERTRPAIQPATDSRGRSVWRSGRYLME